MSKFKHIELPAYYIPDNHNDIDKLYFIIFKDTVYWNHQLLLINTFSYDGFWVSSTIENQENTWLRHQLGLYDAIITLKVDE